LRGVFIFKVWSAQEEMLKSGPADHAEKAKSNKKQGQEILRDQWKIEN